MKRIFAIVDELLQVNRNIKLYKRDIFIFMEELSRHPRKEVRLKMTNKKTATQLLKTSREKPQYRKIVITILSNLYKDNNSYVRRRMAETFNSFPKKIKEEIKINLGIGQKKSIPQATTSYTKKAQESKKVRNKLNTHRQNAKHKKGKK